MKKGRKSPTFGCKPSARDCSNGHKEISPGVTSGKTQASTLYTGNGSEFSGKTGFNFGKT